MDNHYHSMPFRERRGKEGGEEDVTAPGCTVGVRSSPCPPSPPPYNHQSVACPSVHHDEPPNFKVDVNSEMMQDVKDIL